MVITNKLSTPVYLKSCFALSSNHPRFSLTPRVTRLSITRRIALTSGALTGPISKLIWKIKFDPELHNETAIDTCVENLSGAILKALAASTPSVDRVPTHGLRYRPA